MYPPSATCHASDAHSMPQRFVRVGELHFLYMVLWPLGAEVRTPGRTRGRRPKAVLLAVMQERIQRHFYERADTGIEVEVGFHNVVI